MCKMNYKQVIINVKKQILKSADNVHIICAQ